MTSSLSIRRQRESAVVAGAIGTLLVALAVMASLKEQQALIAALAGAAGVALWRQSATGTWRAPALVFDLFAFAIFAIQRNDGLAFWQLVGPWADVARFNVTGAAIAYAFYIVGTLFALASVHRPLRPIEAAGLIVTPFMFNLLVALGADWHMAEIAKFVVPGNMMPFPAQVFIGRTLMLFFISEVGLSALSLIALNRLPDSLKLHALIVASAAIGAGTPLIANFAQVVVNPFLAIFVGARRRRDRAGGPLGHRLCRHRPAARRARRTAAKLRCRAWALAHRLRQGRDLRRRVHGAGADGGARPEPTRDRRGAAPRRLDRRRRSAARSAFPSLRR